MHAGRCAALSAELEQFASATRTSLKQVSKPTTVWLAGCATTAVLARQSEAVIHSALITTSRYV
jgi:hypothetical protein